MSLDWSVHTCSYYCDGDTHAVPVLARPETPPEVIAAVMRLGLEASDTLLEIRPAREADVALWRTEFRAEWTGWNSRGCITHRSIELCPQMSAPYLAMIQRHGDTPDGSA